MMMVMVLLVDIGSAIWCGCGHHIWPLVALHVRGERGRRIVASITNCALEWFPMIVSFEVNFEMVATRKGASAMLALVSFVASVQLDVTISASFVLEGSITIVTGIDGVLVVMVVVVVAVVDLVVGNVTTAAARDGGQLLLVHQRGRGTR